MSQKLFIDCDPGIDDLLAILAALRVPGLEVVGAAAVAGNVPLKNTVANLGSILAFGGSGDIPYAAGAERPLVRIPVTAEDVHGESGLGSAQLPAAAQRPVDTPAPAFLYECAKKHSDLTVLAIGPLTNLAMAFTTYPALPGMLKEVIIMGGGHAHGNITPKAEFNIYADPHAAHIVFESGVPLTMVGLDATMCAGLQASEFGRVCADTSMGEVVAAVLQDICRYSVGYGLGEVAHVHDLCALLCAVWPELFELASCRVDIELKGQLTFGQTVCDVTGVSKKTANARVAFGVKEQEYLKALRETLSDLK